MALTRPGWGGDASDIDIHIEEHLGIVDKSFAYTSKLAPYVNIRSLRGTNTARIDRMGSVNVAGRKSGETLNVTNVKSDKTTLTVDTVLYTRHELDKFDLWTTDIDARRELAEEDGIALAKQFDEACLIQAMKCADFVAPSHLAGAFNDGIIEPVTITGTAASAEADADLISYHHRKSLEELIKRDLGDRLFMEGVTFVSPAIFTILNEHRRLQNVEYQGGMGTNNFAAGRVAMMNGIRIVETPRIPTAAVTGNALGSAFDLTAAQAQRQVITLIPSLALYAAQVHAIDADYWEWKENFSWVLDTYQSYNIGQRRPDAVAVLDITGIPA